MFYQHRFGRECLQHGFVGAGKETLEQLQWPFLSHGVADSRGRRASRQAHCPKNDHRRTRTRLDEIPILWPAGVDGLADLVDATTASMRPLSAQRRQLDKNINQGQKAAIARVTRVLNSGDDVASTVLPKGFNKRLQLDVRSDARLVEASLWAVLEAFKHYQRKGLIFGVVSIFSIIKCVVRARNT
jgi:hypothetical protein